MIGREGEDKGGAFNRFVEKSLAGDRRTSEDNRSQPLSTSIDPKNAIQNLPLAVAVVGPTGSGKSDLALFLAEKLNGEIVNCDSVQVYAGLDIGSAKVPLAERRSIPHHLISLIPIDKELSAGEYARLARPVVREIQSRGKLPLVTGGTGFYLKALFEGLSPSPGRDLRLRERLASRERQVPGLLHRYLRRFDPVSAGRIHSRDSQKLIRAVELTRLARQPASETQRLTRDGFLDVRLLTLGLDPDRRLLYERLNRRTERMFADGILEETAAHLRSKPESADLPRSLGAVGYRQAISYLQGCCTLAEAIKEAQTRTRQYAKRQLTWFRGDNRVQWLAGFGGDLTVQRQALALLASEADIP